MEALNMKNTNIDDLIERVIKISTTENYYDIISKPPRVKVYGGMGRTIFAKLFGYSMVDYYQDVETRLKAQLLTKIWIHENIKDDTVIKREVGYDYSGAGCLDSGLFGMKGHFVPDKEPFVDSSVPVIKEYRDLDKLKIPDFYEHPLMQKIHKEYEKMKKLVAGRLPVTFPSTVRGTWSSALFLRGFTELYFDVYDNPNFILELLDLLAEARISFEKQRCEFLGKKPTDLDNWFSNCYMDYRYVHASDQYCDEIDGNMMSNDTYKKLIFPSEKKIADFYGRTFYYHSCGNLTKLLDPLLSLPNMSVLHVSSWTDLKKAYEMANKDIIIQKVMHPEDDVLHAEPEKIRRQVKEILETVPDRKLWICADAIYAGDVEKVKQWVNIAKQTVAEYA